VNEHDLTILRDLTKRYLDVCHDPIQDERRRLWRLQNSLRGERPLIYVRAFAWQEMPQRECQCRDPFWRMYESQLRMLLFRNTFGDDFIFEPWLTAGAVHKCSGWGIDGERRHSGIDGGSWKCDYPIKDLDDIAELRAPRHEIDEAPTAGNVARLTEAVGDLITINVDRAPAYRVWSADLSTNLGYLRGIENFMVDMTDNPEGLHRLVKFMGDGVLRTHEQAEAAGDWGLADHQNQAMPYAQELEDPAPNARGVERRRLWVYMAAQEFTGVSPAMHEEFLLRYQLPIIKEFGLSAYGCCEDLTHKIDMLRQIPNLRRIGVSPMADAARCAEQIGTNYVLSYRPSPADMVSYGWNPERARAIMTPDLKACQANNCRVDITLKDVQTVGNDPTRCQKWVELTREVINDVFG